MSAKTLAEFLKQTRIGASTNVKGQINGALLSAMEELESEQSVRDKDRMKKLIAEIRSTAESLNARKKALQKQLDKLQEETREFACKLTHFNNTGNPFVISNVFDESVDSDDLPNLRKLPSNIVPDKNIIASFL